jgi:hypothetical protein
MDARDGAGGGAGGSQEKEKKQEVAGEGPEKGSTAWRETW